MKPLEKGLILITVITALWISCGAILTGYELNENQDVTTLREFGCRWYGGSTSRLSCSCTEAVEISIKKNSIPTFSTTEIEITGCKSIRFEAKSIAEMRNLRFINLSDINSITFDEESINWYGYKDVGSQLEEERFDLSVPSLRIAIYNSYIRLISSHSFRGRINEIILDNVTVENVAPLAFANLLQTEKITIKDSILKNIGLQAFKKFGMENLELDGVVADLVPSRTFSNVTVYQKVLINNCKFKTVRSGAFSIYNPTILQVTNNNIGHLNGEAFKVVSRGVVLFKNNTFNIVDDGAFREITLKRGELLGDTVFTFESNTFSTLTRDSLTIRDFEAKYIKIYINETCDCTNIDHRSVHTMFYTELHCLHEDAYMVVKDFKSNMCSIISNYYIIIIIMCVVTVLVVIITSVLILYYKIVYRSKNYGSEKQNKKGHLSLIVPDGRTYRETELHVIVEKTDLLTTDL